MFFFFSPAILSVPLKVLLPLRQSWYRCFIQLTIRQLLTVMALLFLSWENQWQFWRMTASWHIFNLCDKVVVKRRGWIKLSMTSNVICVVWVLKLVCEWETSSCCWIDLQCWLAAAAEICFSVDKFSHPFSFCAALQYRRVKRGFRWTECGRVDKIKGRYRSWLVYIEQLLFFDWNCLTIVNWGKKNMHITTFSFLRFFALNFMSFMNWPLRCFMRAYFYPQK